MPFHWKWKPFESFGFACDKIASEGGEGGGARGENGAKAKIFEVEWEWGEEALGLD